MVKIPVEKPKEFKPNWIPDDVYPATLIEINEIVIKDRDTLILTFQITKDGEYNGKFVDGLCSEKLNEKTKLFRWASALGVELELGQELDTDLLLGKPCRVVTETKTKDAQNGETWNNSVVTNVLPMSQTSL